MSTKDYPAIVWTWLAVEAIDPKTGETVRTHAMVPVGPYGRIAGRYFTENEKYRLAAREERSAVSHRHYFAAINEAWQNLPDDIAAKYPSPEYLRAKALVETGQCDETNYVLRDHDAAMSLAITLRKPLPFAIMVASGNVLRVMVPHSQSQGAMDKKQFQESKNKVLEYLARLLDISRTELEKRGKEAA